MTELRNIPFGRPMLGEEEKKAIDDVLDSGILAHGKRLEAFEAAFAGFTGAPHAVGVANCTAALHMVYVQLGIGPGDEVIVPAQTHTATAHAVELTGAWAVFVDAELETGNIAIDQIESLITPRTRAISVVHFLGMPVDMPRIMAIAEKHSLAVVEDCALAVGTRLDGKHAGLWGDAGCYSFYPVKHITTGEGGMVISKHQDLAEGIRKLRAFGMDKHVNERKVAGMYDIQGLGFNYRMNEISAAMGGEQMKKLPGFLEKRHENHENLKNTVKEIPGVLTFRDCKPGEEHSHYCFALLLSPELKPYRLKIKEYLKEKGVGTSIYYPNPVPRMQYYAEKYGYEPELFPAAEQVSDGSIALSVGPHLMSSDYQYVTDKVKEAIDCIACKVGPR